MSSRCSAVATSAGSTCGSTPVISSWPRPAPVGADRRAGPLVDLLDRIGVELADHAHRVQAHRQHAGHRAEAEDPEEDDGQHHVGHGADQHDQPAGPEPRSVTRRRVAGRQDRQRHADDHREQRRRHHDRHGLPAQPEQLADRREVQRKHPPREIHCVAAAVDERRDVDPQIRHRQAAQHHQRADGQPDASGPWPWPGEGALRLRRGCRRHPATAAASGAAPTLAYNDIASCGSNPATGVSSTALPARSPTTRSPQLNARLT